VTKSGKVDKVTRTMMIFGAEVAKSPWEHLGKKIQISIISIPIFEVNKTQ
jgi:hypothetical protein